MHRVRSTWACRTALLLVATCHGLGVPCVRAQSEADLATRIVLDGQSHDFSPWEAVFRNTGICSLVTPAQSCNEDEEPATDSSSSALQDLRQVYVTWDATRLYLAADATLGGHVLFVLLDFRPGGLGDMSRLLHWRRGLHFGPDFRPDALLVVRDAVWHPELWLVEGPESLKQVSIEAYEARATFDGEARGRSVEAAIPWALLFPDAALASNPEPGAPKEPMFVLPESSSRNGLRIVALVAHQEDGFSCFDVAPDNTTGIPFDPRLVADIDRAGHVAWDEQPNGAPHFVDFGVSVQAQSASRVVPAASIAQPSLVVTDLETFAVGPGLAAPTASRLLLADAGHELVFRFEVQPPAPSRLYVSASVYSLRGTRVVDLYRDQARDPDNQPFPFDSFGHSTSDRWDGRDSRGRNVTGGIYVLRFTAGLRPGVESVRLQHAITVVR